MTNIAQEVEIARESARLIIDRFREEALNNPYCDSETFVELYIADAWEEMVMSN